MRAQHQPGEAHRGVKLVVHGRIFLVDVMVLAGCGAGWVRAEGIRRTSCYMTSVMRVVGGSWRWVGGGGGHK